MAKKGSYREVPVLTSVYIEIPTSENAAPHTIEWLERMGYRPKAVKRSLVKNIHDGTYKTKTEEYKPDGAV